MANTIKYTPKRVSLIISALAEGYSVTAACQRAGIAPKTYYNWRDEHKDFAADADGAIEQGTDRLEDIARDRATRPLDGSDTLLIFLLKARRPERYREIKELHHTGDPEQPISIRLVRT